MQTPLNRSLKAEENFWNKQEKTYKKTIDLKYFQYEDFENKVICEVGCGASAYIFNLKNAKKRIGIDPLIDYYIKKKFIQNDNPSIVLINSTAERIIELENESVDIIFALNMLDHTENPKKVLDECFRILKNNGIIYIVCNIVRNILGPFRKLLWLIDKPHPHHFSKKDFYQMLSEFNYELMFQEVKRVKYHNYSFKAKVGSKLMNEYTLILKNHLS